jgi:hypothetical protein
MSRMFAPDRSGFALSHRSRQHSILAKWLNGPHEAPAAGMRFAVGAPGYSYVFAAFWETGKCSVFGRWGTAFLARRKLVEIIRLSEFVAASNSVFA